MSEDLDDGWTLLAARTGRSEPSTPGSTRGGPPVLGLVGLGDNQDGPDDVAALYGPARSE